MIVKQKTFKKLSRQQAKLRMAMVGASGSGKTYSALLAAQGLGGKTAFIDTEGGRANFYAKEFDITGLVLDPPYSAEYYIELIHLAEKEGFDNLIIDSISHEWKGLGGILENLSNEEAKGAKFAQRAWRSLTPRHNRFLQTITASPLHIICTVRAEATFFVDFVAGKTETVKHGGKPHQREGWDYDFNVIFSLYQKHTALVSKDNTQIWKDQIDPFHITPEVGVLLKNWLNDGVPAPSQIFKNSKIDVTSVIPGMQEQTNIDDLNNYYMSYKDQIDDHGTLISACKKRKQELLEK